MIKETRGQGSETGGFVKPPGGVKDLGETTSTRKSIELLGDCVTPYGFQAALPVKDEKVVMADSAIKGGTNYPNIWSRDGVINGLAALATGDPDLIKCFKSNLETLARHQDDSGAIPSNVNPTAQASPLERKMFFSSADGEERFKTSFGGTVGRIDASTWYIIGVSQYAKHTGDQEFLKKHSQTCGKALGYLRAMETNGKGMLFVPRGGNWADEYVIEGYTLYDNALYHQSLKEYTHIAEETGKDPKPYHGRAERVRDVIQNVLWPSKDSDKKFHPGLQKSLNEKARKQGFWKDDYFLGAFGPGHEFTRFDALGNFLTIIFGIADEQQTKKILGHAEGISENKLGLTPAFHPVIKEDDPEYLDLKKLESLGFKNHPHQYHNGGIWPMNNGFRVLAEVKAGRVEEAGKVAWGVEKSVAYG